jgi:hypothetical protein
MLYGGFILICLYNGFWPSIQWTRTTKAPISANDLAGVYPIACHSHNDYWRPQPLATALLNGCISVEADVWLRDGQVLVGHTENRLSRNRTLSALYIEPLLRLLQDQSHRTTSIELASNVVSGVFDSDPLQSLTLMLDFKTDDPNLWPQVHRELEPLRRQSYLTHFNGTHINEKEITVVVSGSAPFAKVMAQEHFRDIFYDAPLNAFSSASSEAQSLPDQTEANDTVADGRNVDSPTNAAVYSSANSYYASGNFKRIVGHVWHSKLSEGQLGLIRSQIQGAHARGLKVRYWGVPSWPLGVRNYLWRVLVREGVDVLSVENVRAVAHDNWGPRKGGCMDGDMLRDADHGPW